MPIKTKIISFSRVRDLLDYDPDTGIFTWRFSRKGIRRGSRPGYIDPSNGYLRIMIDNGNHYGHRLAWLLVHGVVPDLQIDHINGVRTDNRICNLRLATHAENCQNQSKRSLNTTGFKGVVRYQDRFLAQIKKDGKGIFLGIFPTAEEAHSAYCGAATELYGEFARFE